MVSESRERAGIPRGQGMATGREGGDWGVAGSPPTTSSLALEEVEGRGVEGGGGVTPRGQLCPRQRCP